MLWLPCVEEDNSIRLRDTSASTLNHGANIFVQRLAQVIVHSTEARIRAEEFDVFARAESLEPVVGFDCHLFDAAILAEVSFDDPRHPFDVHWLIRTVKLRGALAEDFFYCARPAGLRVNGGLPEKSERSRFLERGHHFGITDFGANPMKGVGGDRQVEVTRRQVVTLELGLDDGRVGIIPTTLARVLRQPFAP